MALAGLLAAGGIFSTRANVILDWNAVMMAAIRSDNTSPALSARNLAILHVAIYDAVNSIARTHQPYLSLLDAPPGASAEAAASAAGYEVLKTLYPGIRARSDETFDEWLASAPDHAGTASGLSLGAKAAHALLAARISDGSATDVPYIPSDAPGQWRRTPPFFRPPLTPQWRFVVPFALSDPDRFVPGPPPALDSPEYAQDVNTVKMLGGKGSAVRTAEQSQIAQFWSDFSYTAMPPGHWHEIAASIARSTSLGLEATARLMALLSIAQADSAVICWEAKYRYNLWRPITAIRRADEDKNPATEPDPAWDHYLVAPPFPAYTSGHSIFSAASAQILTLFFETDSVAFTAASDSLPGVFRTFNSLAACADEVGMSRIYGGIHFPSDNLEGKRCGRMVAEYVFANWLLPNEELPLARIEAFNNGTTRLRVHGRASQPILLERLNGLSCWEPIATNTPPPGGTLVQVPTEPTLFFRAQEWGAHAPSRVMIGAPADHGKDNDQ